ncbi:hypothetical protein [Streptomyces longispororuber]|uniref:hypothetical protein n=1 Tax=Streptomyces longispororuber TaxID=68230 RepID=UPI0036F718DE
MVTDDEREQHVAALRGLLYPACPAAAVTATAEAIAQHGEDTPGDQNRDPAAAPVDGAPTGEAAVREPAHAVRHGPVGTGCP